MSVVTAILVGAGIGVIAALAAFFWLNRNQAARLDTLEALIRNYTKAS